MAPTQPETNPITPYGGMFARRINRTGFIVGLFGWTLLIFAVFLVYALLNFAFSSAGLTDSLAARIMNSILFLFSMAWVIWAVINNTSLYIRRLHDLNQTGLFTFLLLIPAADLFLTIYLMAAKGTPGANTYGQPVRHNGLLDIFGFGKPRS